jgi:hypothetical protein
LRSTDLSARVGEGGDEYRLCCTHFLGKLGQKSRGRDQLESIAANQPHVAARLPDLRKEFGRIGGHISISASSPSQLAWGEGVSISSSNGATLILTVRKRAAGCFGSCMKPGGRIGGIDMGSDLARLIAIVSREAAAGIVHRAGGHGGPANFIHCLRHEYHPGGPLSAYALLYF